MSFSFSLASKSSSKLKPIKPLQNFDDDNKSTRNDDDSQKYVTEFNTFETPTDNGNQNGVVIAPIQNEWRPHKRMKNLDLPIAQSDGSGILQFEVDSLCDATESTMSYGLNLRQAANGDDEINCQDQAIKQSGKNERPRFTPTEDVLLQKLKFDLQRLPEDRGMAEFEDVPVEGFGAALLSGYGWYEGRGIGKNAKEDVKVVEYKKRTDKQGLGFASSDLPPLPNSNRNYSNNLIPKSKDNSSSNNNSKESLVGKEVRIVHGRDLGLKGRVLEKLSDNRLVVRLSSSGETVKVEIRDVAELGSKEDETCLKKLKELRIREEEEKKEKKKKNKNKRRETRSRDSDSERQEQKQEEVSWLTSHIRVRIISRDLKGGRLYLKKGEVVDVVGPRVCDVSMDDGRELIQGVSQDVLETALPRHGGPVLVLSGKHKGVYGSLVERDLDRETGIVRDADTHDMINVRLEQIAEYMGDPSYLGF